MEFKDYYTTLGVTKSASNEDIKKAFKKLALQYHPDRNKGDGKAEERFKEISEAYEVLGDPDKRAKYDSLDNRRNAFSQKGGSAKDFDWKDFVNTRNSFNQEVKENFGSFQSPNFSDFFENLFASGKDSSKTRKSTKTSGPEFPYSMSLEEAYKGVEIQIERNGQPFKVPIPAGIRDGMKVAVNPKNPSINSFFVKVSVNKHPVFERDGDDLKAELSVDLYTAVLGGDAEFKSLKGVASIKISPGTENGTQRVLKGLGMPSMNNKDHYGDLFLTIKVQIPRELSTKERDLFEKLQKMRKK